MDIAFANEKDIFLVTYLDDLIVFSKSDEDHWHHLGIVFRNAENLASHLTQ